MLVLDAKTITVERMPKVFCDSIVVPVERAPRTFMQWLRGDDAKVTKSIIVPSKVTYTDLVFTSYKAYENIRISVELDSRVYTGLIVSVDFGYHTSFKYRHCVKIEDARKADVYENN